ncbi:uncharacterized protein LOC124813452 isoform X3 [Hydra vulgaris]|uniref:uncharacterized protein LOC124813452 isoform X3 n=1 Tax=Hydra vulgaris TaxID=6087 RepID=UPI0032EA6A7A
MMTSKSKSYSSIRRRIRARVQAHLEDIQSSSAKNKDNGLIHNYLSVDQCNSKLTFTFHADVNKKVYFEKESDLDKPSKIADVFDDNQVLDNNEIYNNHPSESDDNVYLQMSDSDNMKWESESEIFTDTDESDNYGNEGLLVNDLAQWAVEENISHKSLKSLLHILQPHHSFLPLDPRTLLSTPRYVSYEKLNSGGIYHHFGIASCLQKLFKNEQSFVNLSGCSQLSMQCNIDGLPIFKSIGLQLWPILGLLKQPSYTSNLF